MLKGSRKLWIKSNYRTDSGGGSYRLRTIRKILPIFLFLIALISIILINKSEAKYSVGHIYEDIVTGNVVNNTGDLIIEKIYIDDNEVDNIPEGNYEVDDRSECTVHGDKQDIEFSYENGKLGIFGVVKRNTKCTIYLNTIKDQLDTIIAQAKTDKPDFSKTSCLVSPGDKNGCEEATNGIYEEETNLGKTYYYRGTVNNNWVKYGTNAEGQPIWWRIIRINEDRTVRLIYAGEGEQAPATDDDGYWIIKQYIYGINNTGYAFNNSYDYNAYVGYMYGTPRSDSFEKEHGYDLIDSGEVDQLHNSDAKTIIDEWYKNNLQDEDSVLSGKTGFCGDRSLSDIVPSYDIPNKGYGTDDTALYKAYDRLFENYTPSFECLDSAHDLYTTKTDKGKGNGALDYPIGLITADEVAYAGGIHSPNYGYWLSKMDPIWTMTPSYFLGEANAYNAGGIDGSLDSGISVWNYYVGLRPVVNVKPEYFQTEGLDGTIENPYIVKIS